ncbi:MAG: hypothetical protein K2H35_03840, partial [Muribaculaceae bacterium]|nr:hypothetical protein [Muribaculaceae bacterium]
MNKRRYLVNDIFNLRDVLRGLRKGCGVWLLTSVGMLIAGASMLSSCSMTKRLTEGETLYRGVKKFDINPPAGEKLPEEMVADMKAAIDVAPNGPMPFMSPYMTQPFPVGLWIYNAMNDSTKGLKGWIYRHFARTPVLISDVRPELRTT